MQRKPAVSPAALRFAVAGSGVNRDRNPRH